MNEAGQLRQLWQSVIIRAVLDAARDDMDEIEADMDDDKETIRIKNVRRRAYNTEQRQADAWLRGNSEDFRHVCSLAGFDPGFIRDAYMAGRINVDDLKGGEEARKRYAERKESQ